MEKFYLKYGRAADAANPTNYRLYRALEAIPGALIWFTFILIVLASWQAPFWASFFIIAFDLYWLLKTMFLSLHLRVGYKTMRKNLSINWLKKLRELASTDPEKYQKWQNLYHLIILPFAKESHEIVRDTVLALAHSNYPKEKIMVILAAEERAGQLAQDTARKIAEELGNKFFKFLVTTHPAHIPGEVPGKGSNETWAARQAKEKIIDPAAIPYENIIVSSLDIDTRLYPDYLGILSWNYLTTPKPLRSSYQPIPIYNNNIWDAPFFSRVVATSGTFWQMMQQVRPERLSTFSSHSIPFKALVEMNYWHTNIVSEDSRIFWQALLFYNGDWRTVPLYYPVSMDANVGPTLWQTAKNVYRQQRRWGWGVENLPYTLFGFLKNKALPLKKKIYFTFVQLEGFWSWGTNALIIFFLGWLPIILGGERFNVSLISYNLPRVTRLLMTLSMTGLVTSAILSTALLPPRPPHRKKTAFLGMIVQWLFLPLTIIFFGSLPGIDAQTKLMLGKYMGFWVTPKWRQTKT